MTSTKVKPAKPREDNLNPTHKPSVPSMDTFFIKLPFAFPVSESNGRKINDILGFSLRQQKDDKISDNAEFIVLVIHQCLEAIGVEARIVFGERTIQPQTNYRPHVWLMIQGYIVDNTYVKELQNHNITYIEDNFQQCYRECEYDKNLLKQTPSIESLDIDHYSFKKRLNFFIHQPNKGLALGLNREQSYNYYFAMIRHMYDEYKVSIKGIDPRVRYMCWYCERYPKNGINFITDVLRQGTSDDQLTETKSATSWQFQHCSQCMVASYCDRECQMKDWAEIHQITCISRGSMNLSPLPDLPPYSSETKKNILSSVSHF
ncbi:unnamed protein product [Lymnaea stagnalis]|uniref:MYND-type domain-containing protein n=1 Tax=Lymnaea stagnalis TaxID=6523 RepID=A0AAV2H7Y5_LYMST